LSYLTTADYHHSAIAWNAVYIDEKQCRPRLEDIRIWIGLRAVKNDGTVTLHGVRVIQLHEALSHIHRVCREPAA
jgi:hypothetical protein